MKKQLIQISKKLGLLLLSIAIFFCSSGFKILDRDGKKNDFLWGLGDLLDDIGIDIVQDWESKVRLEGNPTLAPIANYNVSILEKETDWTKAFSNFYANALVAIENDKVTINEADFLEQWKQIPIEKRIFISFTKADLIHAEAIKVVLQEQGYQVFLYTESHRGPFTDPNVISYCMKTSGEVLVLDTHNSRTKEGVIAEALSFAKYTYRPEKDILAENEILQKQIKKEINKIKFSEKSDEEIMDRLQKYFKEQEGLSYTREEINKMMKDVFKTESNYYMNINEAAINSVKQDYSDYMLNSAGSSSYGYNKKLSESLSFLQNNPIISILESSFFRKAIGVASYFAICPYYKIPLRLCPICSKGLR